MATLAAKSCSLHVFGGGLRTGEVLALQWDDWDGEKLHLSRSMRVDEALSNKLSLRSRLSSLDKALQSVL